LKLAKLIQENFALFFPVFFVSLWLVVTTILALFSGWFRLMTRFPNQSAESLLRIRGVSGTMGLGISMRGILILNVCRSGMRIGMMRIFGPFCRDFFVPWGEIAVARKTTLFWPIARLNFGSPGVGRLCVSAHVADRLARAANGSWPEAGPFPIESRKSRFYRLSIEWAAATCFAALFFIVAPRVLAPDAARPPIVVAILFPAIVFGIATIVRYVWEGR
jgi:hypothetical protein